MDSLSTDPGPVLFLKASSINATTMVVSWDAPNTLGPLVDVYRIDFSTSCHEEVISSTLQFKNHTHSVELTVEEASNYTITVTASNSVGDGDSISIWHYTPAAGGF